MARVNLPVIEFLGVSVWHPRHPGHAVVAGVDWAIETGDRWVLIGPSESGKSSLLETAAGLRPALAGELRWWGLRAPSDEAGVQAWRRRIGLVFDGDGRPFHHLSVAENIALPLCYHEDLPMSEALDRVEPLVSAFGLESVAALRPGRLNRGAARRAALARALTLRPDALLIDNPAAGAEPSQLRACRELLETFAAGHPWLSGRPLTLVIAVSEAGPWLSLGNKYAAAESGSFRIVSRSDAADAQARHAAAPF